eukprot:jgi/Ulvmu1/9034/UM005_0126.1
MKLIVRFKELQVCDPANPDVSRTAESWVMDGVYRVSDAEAPAGSDAADMTGTDNKKRKRGDERPAEGSGESPTKVLRHQSDDSDIHHTAGELDIACLAEDTVAARACMPAAQPSEDVVTADETAGMQSSALYTSGERSSCTVTFPGKRGERQPGRDDGIGSRFNQWLGMPGQEPDRIPAPSFD